MAPDRNKPTLDYARRLRVVRGQGWWWWIIPLSVAVAALILYLVGFVSLLRR